MDDALSIARGVTGRINVLGELLLVQHHRRCSSDFQHLEVVLCNLRDTLRTFESSCMIEDSSTAVQAELVQCLADCNSTIETLISEIPQQKGTDNIYAFIFTLERAQLAFACLLSPPVNRRPGENAQKAYSPTRVEGDAVRAKLVMSNCEDPPHPPTTLPPPNRRKTATPPYTLDLSQMYAWVPMTGGRVSPHWKLSYIKDSPGRHSQVKQNEKDTITGKEGPAGPAPLSTGLTHRQNMYLDAPLLVVAVVGAAIMTRWKDYYLAKCILDGICGRGNMIPNTPFGLPAHELSHIGPVSINSALASGLASPATLIIGATATGLALSTWYSLRRDERYQDFMIIGAVGAGTVIGLLAELSTTDVLLQILPWCGIAAMLLSSYRLRQIDEAYYER